MENNIGVFSLRWLITFATLYLSCAASIVHAQGFIATSPLNSPASSHAAALLADGRVLSIGLTVEIYDPETGQWTVKKPMNEPRGLHSATRLNNNKILVAGGGVVFEGDFIALDTAEIYDVITDTWSTVGSLQEARSEPQATLLNNGKVLVTAGDGAGFATLASAELFDPSTNSWSSAGSMTAKRSRHRQTLLDNGEVLVAGGREFNAPSGHPALSSVEIYTPGTNSWRAGVSMSEAHYSGAMIKLLNGNVLMATGAKQVPGSCCAVQDHGGSEIYNPITDSWSSTGQMNTPRRSSRVSILCDGRVLVSGGFPTTASAEIYDPVLATWNEVGPMPVERREHTSTLLSNCDVLIAGGQDDVSALASAILYTSKVPEEELCVPIKASNGNVALICL